MKFRKKPIVIEAEQWFYGKKLFGVVDNDSMTANVPYIETLEGKLWVSEGDWIIKGINGELYPCKPDIFEKTYEKVNQCSERDV